MTAPRYRVERWVNGDWALVALVVTQSAAIVVANALTAELNSEHQVYDTKTRRPL